MQTTTAVHMSKKAIDFIVNDIFVDFLENFQFLPQKQSALNAVNKAQWLKNRTRLLHETQCSETYLALIFLFRYSKIRLCLDRRPAWKLGRAFR